MIRTTAVAGTRHAGVKFKEHGLAHKYLDGLNGIEIGPAAHNPFGLEGCKAVGLGADMDELDYAFFKKAQLDMCGEYAEIDISAQAESIPLESGSIDYVLSSHVIEHLPNPIKAFIEWDRLIRVGGYIFSIVPLRYALPSDQMREITPLNQIIKAYEENWEIDTVPFSWEKMVPGGRRGHYFVWEPGLFMDLIDYCVSRNLLNWKVIEIEEIDTKVGNGFTIVAQKIDPTEKGKD